MKYQIQRLLCLFIIGIAVVSCSKDDPIEGNTTTKITIGLQAPAQLEGFKAGELEVVLKESNTGKETKLTTKALSLEAEVEQGLYDIQVSGKASYTLDGKEVETDIAGTLTGSQVSGTAVNVTVPLSIVVKNAGFVIEEIFFTGNNSPEGLPYNADKYFKIYNNSDEVLYADGLAIAMSQFTTDDKQDYQPNIMEEAFTVNAITRIPGSGKDHPVNPGESIIIAEDGINHKELNANAIDLRKANFEMYYPNTKTDVPDDVDEPTVPNMDVFLNRMVVSQGGNNAYILAKIPVGITANDYFGTYKYVYQWEFVFEDYSIPQEDESYKIPNEWILDAVNLSPKAEFQWIVTASSLDRGWTYCGESIGDEAKYGHSVIRKTLTTSAAGHRILQDTNNSTADFTPNSDPSLK